MTPVALRADTGEVLTLDTARWHDDATPEEQDLLSSVAGPVLDLGCGPGRLVLALARRGVPALGIDSSPFAVATALKRGAVALERDVFGPLPGEGRWATVLLFDGNIGIGGDPERLLARGRRLIWTTGCVLVEVVPPGTGHRRLRARLERAGERSAAFPWSLVGADAIATLAAAAGLAVDTLDVTPSGRWFARLVRPSHRLPARMVAMTPTSARRTGFGEVHH